MDKPQVAGGYRNMTEREQFKAELELRKIKALEKIADALEVMVEVVKYHE